MPAGRTTTRQPSGRRRAAAFGIVSLVTLLIVTLPGAGLAEGQVSDRGHSVDRALDRALRALVAMPSAPPGVVAVVERGRSIGLHRAGIGDLRTGSPISGSDHMRLASGPPAARVQIADGICPQSISHGVLARVGRVRKGETRVAKGDPVRARLLLGDKIVHRYAFSYPSFAGLLPVRNFRELRTSSREETLAQTLKPLYESSTSITVTTPSAKHRTPGSTIGGAATRPRRSP
jgi:hypothetical protein